MTATDQQSSPSTVEPAPGEPVLVAAGVTKTFGEVVAVRAVDLTVHAGQICGVLGPNGAGKTTLLRMALGLVRPDSGRLTVLGHAPGSPQALARIGAMIESPALVPGLTGRVNLQVLARARALPDAEVERVLELVELRDAADRPIKTYSLGMRQRLGVAGALLGTPSILILDEPTNGLDPDGVVAIRQLIKTVASTGVTVLLSSHVLSEVEQSCERVIVMHHGEVAADSDVAALVDSVRSDRVEIVAPVDAPVGAVLVELGATQLRTADRDGRTAWSALLPDIETADVLRVLVGRGISVEEVIRERRSLEDAFFTLTHDGRA